MDNMGGVLTKGLGADMSAMIIGRFRLKLITVEVIVPIGGGGSHPLAPGEIQNFYKPVKGQWNKHSQIQEPKKHVFIRVTFRAGSLSNKEYSKDFVITKNKADIVVKVLDFANKAKDKISITFKQLGRVEAKLRVRFLNVLSNIKVFVSNFRKIDKE